MNAVRTTANRNRKVYPNAADRQYYLNKLTESVLSAAICVGVVTILFFLVTCI